MRKSLPVLILIVAALSMTAIAQMEFVNDKAPAFTCPASGYFAPMYGVMGRNGGDGTAPTEAMSPCPPAA